MWKSEGRGPPVGWLVGVGWGWLGLVGWLGRLAACSLELRVVGQSHELRDRATSLMPCEATCHVPRATWHEPRATLSFELGTEPRATAA